ncbi:MAG: cell surface protein SprA, partial [Bacteroidota bacterium]|nr:cell surface protein SprA [Bacteroidota bacterium]
MKGIVRYLTIIIISSLFISGLLANRVNKKLDLTNDFSFNENLYEVLIFSPDTGDTDLQYHFDDESNYPIDNFDDEPSGLDLSLPSNITSTVEFDPVTGEYIFKQKIGDLDYRRPSSMTIEEYIKYDFDKSARDYFRERSRGESFANQTSLIPKLHIGGEIFDQLFGSNTINIQPQGSAELIFGINIQKTDNPSLPVKLRRTTTFDFQEKIQMNVTGQIGDKMRIQTNYNTESTFDFENKMNLRYEGKEDEIVQIVEAGDVTLPLSGTLITGSQSLFGLKTELKFGKLRITSVFSQQKGESSNITVEGGAQLQDFEVWGDEYEANKHFFLSQYFKDRYDESLRTMPIISSGITINKIEVWVTNKSGNFTEARNFVAFLDLGEGKYNNPTNPEYGMYDGNSNIFNEIWAVFNGASVYPDNETNDLYNKMTTTYAGIREVSQVSSILGTNEFINAYFLPGQDYEKVEKARKLNQSEYTLNANLGYLSINSALNADEVLAVAFEYTVLGKTYQVGEFSSEAPADPAALILKLLKGTYLSPTIKIQSTPVQTRISPTWELMMKNIYAIGAYQVNPKDFILNVMYQNDLTGTSINYIAEGPKPDDGGINGMPLLQALNLDNLNSNLDPSPDGFFDFVTGITINPSNGRIIFPVREPFGAYLRKKITAGDPDNDAVADKYVYEALYDSTKTTAANQSEKNKFYLAGTYQSSSSSEISLNALNVPQGSVKVTAGGMQLTENQDYTVDYTLGRVKIINMGLLESGTPINISLESNSMFNIQSKTLLGTHFDYRFNNDLNVGATILNLTERPLTSKVNIGDEPISNTIWGIDGNYRTEAPFITKMIDKIPFIETKEKSTITMYGEFAQLIPGHSKAIDKNGVSYIDDFEGSKTSIDIKTIGAWVLASTPQMQDNLFPEAKLNNNRAYGFNRARIAWYNIDPLFLRNNNTTPGHIENDTEQQSSHFVREIFEKEIFPNKETPNGIPTNIPVLNISFYPEERGPYNYETTPTTYSDGLTDDGEAKLENPETRWGGIMRKLSTSDFEAANIEFIEFWLMDPFAEDADSSHTGGNLYFNLGNISEDILKDSRKAFENGYPTSDNIEDAFVDTTTWGRVPLVQSLVNAFDNNIDGRPYQDVGFDGLSSEFGDEQSFFADYLEQIDSLYSIGEINQEVYEQIYDDPSNDDYHYFRGGDYDSQLLSILDRYKKFNNNEGNSPASEQSDEDYPTTATTIPDVEDINHDNTLSEVESYYQYVIPITYQNLRHDRKYINDIVKATVNLKNGKQGEVKWYQFKVPIYEPDQVVGSISDFKSIRFLRMFLHNFEDEVVLRFARMDLVRGEWRKYNLSLRGPGEYEPSPQPVNASFDVSAVNIEENGSRTPVNYILPPGIDRVIDPTNPQLRQLNEQSIVLRVIDLEDGDARAAYRNVDMDIRQYKRLKLEVHAEALDDILYDDDLRVFIRLGSDYKRNYYEYEVPLKLTDPGHY